MSVPAFGQKPLKEADTLLSDAQSTPVQLDERHFLSPRGAVEFSSYTMGTHGMRAAPLQRAAESMAAAARCQASQQVGCRAGAGGEGNYIIMTRHELRHGVLSQQFFIFSQLETRFQHSSTIVSRCFKLKLV